jgi:ubiquinone/menaquinone biosynthesis C-methylase UbiE
MDAFLLSKFSFGTRLRVGTVKKYLKNLPSLNRILECGCGVGVYSGHLKEISNNTACFDINNKSVRIAASNVRNVNFLTASILDIPFKNRKFDAVIATDILEHLLSPETAVKELYRVLSNGGELIVTIPSDKWEIAYKLFNLKKEHTGNYKLYSRDEIISLFAKNGFAVHRHRKSDDLEVTIAIYDSIVLFSP